MDRKLKLILIASLAGILFLAIMIPAWRWNSHLESDNSKLKSEIALLRLRDLCGQMFIEASRRNYGNATQLTTKFFDDTQALASNAPDEDLEKDLQTIASKRNDVISGLGRGDAVVQDQIRSIFEILHKRP